MLVGSNYETVGNLIVKVGSNVLVVILNYVFSKLLVFRKDRSWCIKLDWYKIRYRIKTMTLRFDLVLYLKFVNSRDDWRVTVMSNLTKG